MFLRRKISASALAFPKVSYRSKGLWTFVVQVASSLLSLALPLLVLQIYDRILVYEKIETLDILCLFAIIAILAESLLRFCLGYDVGLAAQASEHALQSNLVRQIMAVGPDSAKLPAHELSQLSYGIGRLRDVFAGRLMLSLVDLPFIVFFLLIIYLVAGPLVFVPLLSLGGLLLWVLGKKGRYVRLLRERDEKRSDAHRIVLQFLENIHVIKALGVEGLFNRIYEKRQFETTVSNYKISAMNARLFDGTILFARAIVIGTAFWGAIMAVDRQISMGVLIACVILAGRIVHPVQRAIGYFQLSEEAARALENMNKAFEQETTFGTATPSEKASGNVSVRNVTMKDASGLAILDGVSFELSSGDAVVIKGSYGDGRSLLLEAIAGLRRPSKGDIFIDGQDPAALSSEKLLEHVGLLSAVGVVFKGTIYDNLSRFGLFDEARVREIASLLGLDVYLEKLPEGYATLLDGGKSETLPAGIRQLIAIGRVLVSKPKIILYDRADQALDKQAFNALYKLMARLKGRATLVFVSEDRYIQKIADRVFSVEGGILKEEKTKRIETYGEILI